jgi:hypothetical protein
MGFKLIKCPTHHHYPTFDLDELRSIRNLMYPIRHITHPKPIVQVINSMCVDLVVFILILCLKYTNKSGANNGPHTHYPSVRTTFPGKQTNLPLVG